MFRTLSRNGLTARTPSLPTAERPDEPPAAPAPPTEPPPARPRDAGREPDPAAAKFETLKRRIHSQLVDRLDLNRVNEMDPATLRTEIRGVVEHLCEAEDPLLPRADRLRLIEEILDETFGLGPLELLLKDDKIGDIMINGPHNVFIEKNGRIQRADVSFRDNEHLLQIIDRIVSRVGRRVDETSPMVDARLPNGSRVNAIIPPIALDGAVLTIRMFGSKPLNKDDLLRFKAFTPEMLLLLEAAMKARLNIIISGGTGSGKTTLLNTLSSFIQNDHRIITIEDAAELQLQQEHVVRLETRPPNIEGRGAITATDLVKNALRMRPDRIIIGECRGAETLDMIQAMNTGHEGSMTTVHANTPRDALSRLETMISMAGLELPIRALRNQFASAVDLIIQASRLQGGPRKVTSITEVVGMEGDTIIMQEIFAYRQLGVDANGRAFGEFIATGIRPTFMDRLEYAGCSLPADLFRQRVLLKD
ncbi:MAG: secretion system protein TadA [Isosphaeraceae bacterium]|jgi:pilus assembly protein CpaF|nr:MAG: secretion system protein TadA [Isosphaeraceae bacterium]